MYFLSNYGFCNPDYLEHHGIKGQKWGKKNGPPYPLTAEKHNKVVLRNSKNYKVGTGYVLHPSRTRGMYYSSNTAYGKIPMHLKGNNKFYKGQIVNTSASDAFTLANIKTGARLVNPGWFDSRNNMTPFLNRVNPAFHAGEVSKETTNNCSKCSAVVSLMKMGYNQISAGLSSEPMTVDGIGEWFKGAIVNRAENIDDMNKKIEEMPKNSFGIVTMSKRDFAGNAISGHAVSWTKTRDGKIRIEDGQNSKVFNSYSEAAKAYNFNSGGYITRLDNTEPNWSALELDGVVTLRNNFDFKQGLKSGTIDSWIMPEVNRASQSVQTFYNSNTGSQSYFNPSAGIGITYRNR